MDPSQDDQNGQNPQAPIDDSVGGGAPVSTPPADPMPSPAPDAPAEGGEVPPPPPAPVIGDQQAEGVGQPGDSSPAA